MIKWIEFFDEISARDEKTKKEKKYCWFFFKK